MEQTEEFDDHVGPDAGKLLLYVGSPHQVVPIPTRQNRTSSSSSLCRSIFLCRFQRIKLSFVLRPVWSSYFNTGVIFLSDFDPLISPKDIGLRPNIQIFWHKSCRKVKVQALSV